MNFRAAACSLAAAWLLTACNITPVRLDRSPTTGPSFVEAPASEAGQKWSFRLLNGYNGEVVRQYREELVGGPNATLQLVRTDATGETTTERYTPDWDWLDKARPGFGLLQYSPPLEALPFPLQIGRSWSQQVVSNDPLTGQRYPVRINGQVVGWERIKVPAGTFDTVLIKRTVYIGDRDFWKSDTEVYESDWYAPALGRVVRSENTSGYFDLQNSSPPFGRTWVRGDWNVLELTGPLVSAR